MMMTKADKEKGVKPRLKIEEAELHCTKFRLSAEALRRNYSLVKTRPYTLPLQKILYRSFHIAKGNSRLFFPNIAPSTMLPTKVRLFLVKNTTHEGAYDTNPLHFENYGTTNITLKVRGGGTPAGRNDDLTRFFFFFQANAVHKPEMGGITYDFATTAGQPNSYAFQKSIFDGSGVYYSDSASQISMARWTQGFFVVELDLSTCSSNGTHADPPDEGIIIVVVIMLFRLITAPFLGQVDLELQITPQDFPLTLVCRFAYTSL